MPIPNVNGATLLNLTIAQLGGYGNAFDPNDLISYINEGKDEIWAILKGTREDYFLQSSQSTTANDDNYFAKLSTTSREFTLPKDFHQMRMIEVLDSGYEEVDFEYKPMSSAEFVEERRASTSTSSPTSNRNTYLYTIGGKDQLILAQFPEIAFELRLWYTRSLPNLTLSGGSNLDEIMFPFNNKIALFAAKRAMLPLQDPRMWQAWREEWREAIRSVEATAEQRDATGIKLVQDFVG